MAADRITHALRYVTESFGTTRDEFRRDNQPQADMLLDGLLSRGYLNSNKASGIMAVNERGHRKLADEEITDEN